MGDRRQCIVAARIPKFVRAQLNELRGIGVIDYARGVYRISEIALYSSEPALGAGGPPVERQSNDSAGAAWPQPLATTS